MSLELSCAYGRMPCVGIGIAQEKVRESVVGIFLRPAGIWLYGHTDFQYVVPRYCQFGIVCWRLGFLFIQMTIESVILVRDEL